MKSFIVFALIAAVALAAPPAYNGDEKHAETLKNVNDVDVHAFSTQFETTNGIKKEEQGSLQNAGTENEAFVIRGSFSYPGPDGVVYTVTYTADENGYHAQGAHIPV